MSRLYSIATLISLFALLLTSCELPSTDDGEIPISVISATATSESQTPYSVELCNHVNPPKLGQQKNKANIHILGVADLCWYTEDSIDMDNGELGQTDPFGNRDSVSTDIELFVSRATIDGTITYNLLGINNAYINDADVENPSKEHCQEKTSNPVSSGGILSGKPHIVGCFLTNEGRLGYLKINSVDAIGAGSIEISFTTWNK